MDSSGQNHIAFVHLRVHTHLSLLRATCKTEDIIKKAVADKMCAVAKTDYGNMSGTPTFIKDCQDAGIKPIIGTEFDVVFNDVIIRPVTFIALNHIGYKNLVQMNTIAWCEHKSDGDPFIVENDIRGEGLIALIECTDAVDIDLILSKLKTKIETFIEVTNHKLDYDVNSAALATDLGNRYGLKIVVTNDVHYTDQNDYQAYEIAVKIGKRQNRLANNEYYFKSQEQMYELYLEDQWYLNTVEIAERVEDYNIINKDFVVPTFKDKHGEWNLEQTHAKLEMDSWSGLAKKGLDTNQEYVDRLTYELSVMKEKKFSSYFPIISDIVNFMDNQNMLVPIGRGSSVGSLVCYCLGIISIDPIKRGVPFERFINSGRIDLPDVDTDITQEGRPQVLRFIASTHGFDRVAQIATFQTMGLRASIDNVGRVLGVSHIQNRELRNKIPHEATELEDLPPEVKKDMSAFSGWIDYAVALNGVAKNLGIHAAGVVISNEPLGELVPLVPEHEGVIGIQYDMRDVELMGLLKLDMLGLKTLDIISHTLNRIEERYGIKIDVHNLPPDDDETYKLISSGTYASVFQLDSPGYRKLCRKLQPGNFEHIMALNALYRPGPLTGGMTDEYVERRHGRKELIGWHPWLDKELKSTYQVPVFQEQVMAIAKIIAGFDDIQADKYRKAIGKKCLTKDTELLTSNDLRISIKDLIDNQNLLKKFKFKIHSGKLGGNWEEKKVSITRSGKRKIYTIWTSSGRRIRCSRNHYIPTIDGEKKAFKLKIGDYLFRETISSNIFDLEEYNNLDLNIDNSQTIRHGLLLGLLVGDGRCTTSTIGFIQKDGATADLFCNLISRIEFAAYIKDIKSNPSGVPIYSIISTHPSKNYIKELVIREKLNKLAKNKRIPISVKYSNNFTYIRSFLCGLLLSDGFIYLNHKNKCGYVGYSSHSYMLMHDVQNLLSMFNITSSIRKKKYNINKNNKIYSGITYECAIRDGDSILKFKNISNDLLVGYKLKSLNLIYKYLKNKKSNSQLNKWPGIISRHIERQNGFKSFTSLGLRPNQIKNGITQKKLLRLSGIWDDLDNIIHGDLIPDKIVEIEMSKDFEETYDIEVHSNNKECFVANGLLVHNSKQQFDAAQELFKEGAMKRDGLTPPAGFSGSLETWIDHLLERLSGYARYGWNCLSGDTLIATCNHGAVPIKNIIVGEEIWSIRENSDEIFRNKVIKVINNGVRNTFKITTKSGRSIICTSNHRFLTPKHSYEYASNLAIGDHLKIFDKWTSRADFGIRMAPATHQNKIPIRISSNSFVRDNVVELKTVDITTKNTLIPIIDEIINIEKYDSREVWDLTMEQNPNFSANGIWVHNSGHAAGYGLITYITAYLESHYQCEYYASLLDGADKPTKITALMRSILYNDIKVVPPNINKSGITYALGGIDERIIYMGLNAVKSCGKASQSIVTERSKRGEFSSFIDFCQRLPSVNKTIKTNLVKAGAFSWDPILSDRNKLDNIDNINKMVRKRTKKIDGSKIPIMQIAMQCFIDGNEFSDIQRQQNERDVLNSFITGHPAAVYQRLHMHLERGTTKVICPAVLQNCELGQSVLIIGMVDSIRRKIIKSGRNEGLPYVVVILSDNSASVILTIWHPLCLHIEKVISDGQIAMFDCMTRRDKFRKGFVALKVDNGIMLNNGIPIQGVFSTNGDPSNVVSNIGGVVENVSLVGNRTYASIRGGRITVLPNILEDVIKVNPNCKFLLSLAD